MRSLEIDVYGCGFRVSGGSSSAVEMVASDFQFFRRERVDDPIEVELLSEEPPYEEAPDGVATTYTPRNISLTENGCTYVDYSGRALGIWDRGRRVFRIYTKDLDIQYEATYLFLLSHIGECLDKRKMHRIHAMAMGVEGRAVLAILPMGGGKSTLSQGLLRYGEFDFLSDDSPLISADGRVHAFPLRLGLLPGSERDIPPEQTRTIQRMEFGPKVLVNYEYFADRVRPSADPGIVFLGRRSLSRECRIEPVNMRQRYHSMVVNCVVGLGLFQGLEFLLSHSPIAVAAKAGVAWSRLRNARKLFSRSEVYRLTLGRDQQHNAETVREFVRGRLG
ncbi:MAG: hypothetical protein OEU36_19900 [Gammaproteobacteria bacterium]|nr:hypothetical protein [Gammaproteobacteria bacterium]